MLWQPHARHRGLYAWLRAATTPVARASDSAQSWSHTRCRGHLRPHDKPILLPAKHWTRANQADRPCLAIASTMIDVAKSPAPAAPTEPTSRDFLPWRFSDAGRRCARRATSCRRPIKLLSRVGRDGAALRQPIPQLRTLHGTLSHFGSSSPDRVDLRSVCLWQRWATSRS